MTNKQRILMILQNQPEGIDDDELAKIMNFKTRQQANNTCRKLEKEKLIYRRHINGKIRNFLIKKDMQPTFSEEPINKNNTSRFLDWFWEGNVQNAVIAYLITQNYQIISQADTASHQRGIDIVAEKNGVNLWVSVKGYPKGTQKTNPSVQAAHWFKHVIFDIVEYRERNKEVLLAVALPDYSRYRTLKQKITWLQPAAKFSFFWVKENGEVVIE